MAPSPIRAPASTIARQHTTAPEPRTSGSGASRGADECRESFGGLPSTAPSWISQPSPTTVPGWITTWAPIRTSSPSWTPSPRTRPGARSDSRILVPSRLVQRSLQPLQHAHDAQPGVAVRARPAGLAQALDEVLALQPQRLAVADRRAPDVPRAGDV